TRLNEAGELYWLGVPVSIRMDSWRSKHVLPLRALLALPLWSFVPLCVGGERPLALNGPEPIQSDRCACRIDPVFQGPPVVPIGKTVDPFEELFVEPQRKGEPRVLIDPLLTVWDGEEQHLPEASVQAVPGEIHPAQRPLLESISSLVNCDVSRVASELYLLAIPFTINQPHFGEIVIGPDPRRDSRHNIGQIDLRQLNGGGVRGGRLKDEPEPGVSGLLNLQVSMGVVAEGSASVLGILWIFGIAERHQRQSLFARLVIPSMKPSRSAEHEPHDQQRPTQDKRSHPGQTDSAWFNQEGTCRGILHHLGPYRGIANSLAATSCRGTRYHPLREWPMPWMCHSKTGHPISD